MTQDFGTPSYNSSLVSSLYVKSSLWKTNLSLIFYRLEAEYAVAEIACDTTVFKHEVSAVDSDFLNSISNITVIILEDKPYNTLKKYLMKSHS